MVLSADPIRDPSTLAIMGAGARSRFPIFPFDHVLAGSRRPWWTASWSPNPTYEETKAQVNIVVAGTDDGIVMVESGAQQASEAEVLAAIEFGHDCCKKIAAGIRELTKNVGKPSEATRRLRSNQALYDQIAASVRAELKDAMNTQKYEKLESYSRDRRGRRRPSTACRRAAVRRQEAASTR